MYIFRIQYGEDDTTASLGVRIGEFMVEKEAVRHTSSIEREKNGIFSSFLFLHINRVTSPALSLSLIFLFFPRKKRKKKHHQVEISSKKRRKNEIYLDRINYIFPLLGVAALSRALVLTNYHSRLLYGKQKTLKMGEREKMEASASELI